MWVMPIFFAIIFIKPQFVFNYKETLRKLRIHHTALSQGPVKRYVETFFKARINQTTHISGECTQCGNCCLNKQCVFWNPLKTISFNAASTIRLFENCLIAEHFQYQAKTLKGMNVLATCSISTQ